MMQILAPVGPPSFAHHPGDIALGVIVLALFSWAAAIILSNFLRSIK